MAALDHPVAPDATVGMARAFVEVAADLRGQNGHDVADLLVQLALEIDPTLTDARLLASDIASTQKQSHLAASYLQDIPPSDPLWPVIQLRLANLYERDNRPEEAAALLKTLAAKFPNRPEPLTQLGDTLADQKSFSDAVSAYDQAIALLRHPVASDWALFYARGSLLERLHEWPRAEADMNRALELQPNQPYVLNFLGYSLAERNRTCQQRRT